MQLYETHSNLLVFLVKQECFKYEWTMESNHFKFGWSHQIHIRKLYTGSAPKVGKLCITHLWSISNWTWTLSHLILSLPCPVLPQHSPEPLSLVVEGARVSAIGGLVKLWEEGLAGLLAGVVGELDRYGLGGPCWLLSVQALDGLLSLYPLIKADEAHTSGATCGASRSKTNTGSFYFTGFRHNINGPHNPNTSLAYFCVFPVQQWAKTLFPK